MTNSTRFINTGRKTTRKTTAVRRDITDIMRDMFSTPFTTFNGDVVVVTGHATKTVVFINGEPITSVTHSYDILVTDKKLATIKYCDYNLREVKSFLTYECGETF